MSKKYLSLVLALAMCLSICTSAFASNTVTTSGGQAESTVTLTTTDDGTLTGTPTATALSVTVPTALPMAVGQDGEVSTATDAVITNNSYGPIKVSSISITGQNGWTLVPFGSKDTLASEKVDAKKVGFSIQVGTDAALVTDNSDPSSQNLMAVAGTDCYIPGVGAAPANTIGITYDAIVTMSSATVTSETIANIIFIIEWDTV